MCSKETKCNFQCPKKRVFFHFYFIFCRHWNFFIWVSGPHGPCLDLALRAPHPWCTKTASAFHLTSTYLWLACKLVFCLLLDQFRLSYRPLFLLMLFCSWRNITAGGEGSSWLWRLGSHLKVGKYQKITVILEEAQLWLCSSYLVQKLNNVIKYRPVKKCIPQKEPLKLTVIYNWV